MKLTKLIITIITICFLAHSVKAQDKFYSEIGVTGGCGFVLGDTNGMLFRYSQPLGGGFVKYKFNGHFELRLQLDGGLLGYSSIETSKDHKKILSNEYFGTQFVGEFNFFNYGAKTWEPYRTWVSPTILAGVGLMTFEFDGKTIVAATLPLGVGVKFKLSNRINLGAYWMVAKVFSDKLDKTPNDNGSYGVFWNNQDWYSTAQIYLSFNFLKDCPPCHSGVKF